MKKRMFSLLMCGLLMMCFAGCGQNSSDTQEKIESDILKEMEEANALPNILGKHGSITITSSDRNGQETTVHIEETDGGYNQYIRTDNGIGVETASTPKGNFVVTSDGETIYNLFQWPEEYERVKDGLLQSSFYAYNPEEKLVSLTESDGQTTVLAVLHMDDSVAGYSELKTTWGIDDETFDYYTEYVVDSNSLELLESRAYCELSTGRIDTASAVIAYGQPYAPSDALQNCMDTAK